MFGKMSLIEGIGDEVTNFFIILFTFIVLYFAWRSTNVREDRIQTAAVLIIENNRRRLIDRVVQHPITIIRSSSRQSNSSNTTEELEINDDSSSSQVQEIATINEPPNLLSVLDEINNLNTGQNQETNSTVEGAEHILREMDSEDTDGLRRRRLAFFQNSSNQGNMDDPTTINSTNVLDNTDNETANTDNCTNENNENTNINRIVTETIATASAATFNTATTVESIIVKPTNIEINPDQKNNIINETKPKDEMRIKLKYLNDDLKLVNGLPNEAIGDFKKRNFSVELAAQKNVRLVFNGHVLQPDSKTLQACGLFDNCVVHCLIHNRKPQQNQSNEINSNNQNNANENDETEDINISFRRGQQSNSDRNGPLLIYFGMCFISLVLLCGWYCRFRYNYLFSWYSTTGLVLMTGLFLVMIPLNVLLEREATG